MTDWLEVAQGPIFRFALAIFILGLARQVGLIVSGALVAIRRAGDRRLSYPDIARETLSWLFPIRQLRRAKLLLSGASFVFHIGVIVAALFLRNHIDIFQANIGIAWIALPRPLVDGLTLLAIAGATILLLYRVYSRSVRTLSTAMDYILLVMILGILVSGYVAGQLWNPIPYNTLMLFHTLGGITLVILIPFTKIAHCVLFPLTRFCTEIAWRLTPEGGSQVVQTLYGPDGRKV